MQVFDASSMIYAWDNYPANQFPGLWTWIAAEINARRLMMPIVAYGEVCAGTPDCGDWLVTAGLERLEVTNEIAQDAMRIKGLLGVVGDNYHPKGVGENDLLIIATARAHGRELSFPRNFAFQQVVCKLDPKEGKNRCSKYRSRHTPPSSGRSRYSE